jgi:hypothetical protein
VEVQQAWVATIECLAERAREGEKPLKSSVFVTLDRKMHRERLIGRLPQEKRRLAVRGSEGARLVFRDVPVRAWFAPHVLLVAGKDIVTGYADAAGNATGLFKPAQETTYAELAKMVIEAVGKDVSGTAKPPRNPSAQGYWSAPYIATAESLGLSVFEASPDVHAAVTRAEAVSTILEAFEIPLIPTILPAFTDVPPAHPHARAIATGFLYKIIGGDYDSSGSPLALFRPDDPMKRAELAKVLAIVLKLKE